MDTVVSTRQGMGHGERQTIHPFFQPGFGEDSRTAPQHEPASTLTNPVGSSSNTACPSDKLPPQASSLLAPNPCVENPMDNPVSSPLSQEDDPNAGRRKRRKTEKAKKVDEHAPLRAGLSGWLGKEIAAPESSATDLAAKPVARISDIELPAAPALDQLAEGQSADQTIPPNIVPPLDSKNKKPEAQSDKERKTLKLNANGRLLSSPPMSGRDLKGSKRGRPRKTQSKVVIIRYTSKDVGILIDAILNGQKTHHPPPPLPIPREVKVEKKPAKPTHPFFSKRPPKSQEATSDESNESASGSIEGTTSSGPVLKKLVKPLVTSFPSFAPRKPKFQELYHPIWPPRDLVHVIDNGLVEMRRGTRVVPHRKDHKKSKLAAISINDTENALLSGTALARKVGAPNGSENSRPTLRLPTRFTASGKTIQEAVKSQLATSLAAQPSTPIRAPVISKLAIKLPETFSAFDRGKHEHRLWAHKYAPQKAEDVLQVGREALLLRDWLEHLKVTSVDTGKTLDETNGRKTKKEKKKRKKQKQKDGLDNFIVSSEEEESEMDNLSGSDDELAGEVTTSSHRTVVRSGDRRICSQQEGEKPRVANAIVLSGPSGSGKTASVYAVAKELDFEVFEINSGSRRSARDMLERVGDMTQNHLVHLLNDNDDSSAKPKDLNVVDDSKQNKLMSFFKGPPSKPEKPPENEVKPHGQVETESSTKRPREQKQSLILLEEADILFEDDKQFWTGVLTLISQSRRPIVITCNEEGRLPIQDMSLHAILRYQRPPPDLAIDYLLLVAACEGHILKRDALAKLYNGTGFDIRRALMDLNFWCQMAVGSTKSGLDWFLPLWPPSRNADQNGDQMRVLSLNTYESYMGWLNRDLLLHEEPLEKETEALRNTFHWWRLGIQEMEYASGGTDASYTPSDQFAIKSNLERLDILTREAEHSEMRSSLDILCSRCPLDFSKDSLDTSLPPMPTAHRSNYIDAYPLLQTDLDPEYSSLSESIGLTFDTLISRTYRTPAQEIETESISRIFKGWSQLSAARQVYPTAKAGFQKVFEPIMRARYTATPGRLAPSFESSLSTVTEDLAPYIRSIMVFDGRLKEYRNRLYAIWAQDQGGGDKRARTTRASRAALEGSDKAFTRRERWFPDETNYFLVQRTGMPEWQQALFQMGYFHVQPMTAPNDETNQQMI